MSWFVANVIFPSSRSQWTHNQNRCPGHSSLLPCWIKIIFHIIIIIVVHYLRICHDLNHRHGITMIYDRWNHFKARLKSRPHLSYTHYNKAGHEFFDIVPKKRSTRVKNAVERNNLHATYFPKGASFVNNTWSAPPLPRSSSFAIIYAFSSKLAPMTVTWADSVCLYSSLDERSRESCKTKVWGFGFIGVLRHITYISVIYVTAQMCRRTEEEVVPTVGLPTR